MIDKGIKVGIIGLGYVGLPLAVEFSKKYPTFGYDINNQRINALKSGQDHTKEVCDTTLEAALIDIEKRHANFDRGFFPTNDLQDLKDATVYIITVPTPTDKNKQPDLAPLISASESVAKILKKGDLVIYESTVYPGLTEEECVPILERISGLEYNNHFHAGYSPERINPGDKKRTITKIRKVTSGSTPEIAKKVDDLYKSIITAGTFSASSIKVAEAAKVIENAQRDINIAFVNELAKIFNLLEIDTNEVLEAAGTKWNFLPFKPGLVGGHCIGVDPYYLAQKAQELGYHPEIILAGRRLNDSMGEHVASQVIKLLVKSDIKVKGADVLILGITFKENCPDVRNTKVIDLIEHLNGFETKISVFDPWANAVQVENDYGIKIFNKMPQAKYDVIVLAVSHSQFLSLDLNKLKKKTGVIFDVKGVLGKSADASL